MTREQARRELEGTWRFQQTGSMIALREVDLVEQTAAPATEPLPFLALPQGAEHDSSHPRNTTDY